MVGERKYDIIVFGCTGFTGLLTAEYLAKTAPKRGLTFAIAGRNEEKLKEVQLKLGNPAIDYVIADSFDQESLNTMTSLCSAVITTVGPYMKYGEPLVRACVENGTHYTDLTGEYPFMYDIISKYHDQARAKGVKIVHCCGYDCIPVDMCTFLASKGLSSSPSIVRGLCTSSCGLASGGTLDSGKGMFKWSQAPENKSLAQDPYLLVPNIDDELRVDREWTTKYGVGYDTRFGTVTLPYFMSMIDNRVVRRSIALRKEAASFDEAMSFGAVGQATGFLLRHLPSVFASGLRPKAGDGPNATIRNSGYFSFEVRAEGTGGDVCTAYVTGSGDPGYKATSVMLAEAAMCLVTDFDSDESANEEDLDHFKGGVLTPSTAMGEVLIKRLEQTGDFKFTVTRPSAL